MLVAPPVSLAAQRLPGNVVPAHYSLAFTPDLAAETFAGEARIRVNILESTSNIVLHAAGLEIIEAAVTSAGTVYRPRVTHNDGAQTVVLHTPVLLSAGPAELHLTFTGALTRELRGFYISKARGRKYAVTRLQATDARRMFPAFDEPRYKATFDIRATVDAGDTAISNGAVESVSAASQGVIGMTESFAGATQWQQAVNAYVERNRYGNASAQDFWSTASKVTGKPIDRVMSAYVDRTGVPLLHLKTAFRADTTHITLEQEPFGRAAGDAAPSAIPVCLETRGDAGADACHLFDSSKASMTLPGCSRWVIGNAGAERHHRTRHCDDALARLMKSNVALAADERLMLVADHWALVRLGRSDLAPFLKVTRALAGDAREPAVIAAIAARLQFVHEYLTTGQTRERFEAWVRDLFAPALALAEKRIEHTDTTRARHATLLGIVGAIGRDAHLLREAREIVWSYLRGTAKRRLAPELLDAFVALAALSGDRELFDLYRTRADDASFPEERYRFLYALAAFRDEALVRRTLEYARSNHVRTQDRAPLLGRLLSNPAARDMAWKDIQSHWQELRVSLGSFGGPTRVIEAPGTFCDPGAAGEIRAFLRKHEVPGSGRALAQTLDDIEACATLAAAQRSRLDDALRRAAGDQQ